MFSPRVFSLGNYFYLQIWVLKGDFTISCSCWFFLAWVVVFRIWSCYFRCSRFNNNVLPVGNLCCSHVGVCLGHLGFHVKRWCEIERCQSPVTLLPSPPTHWLLTPFPLFMIFDIWFRCNSLFYENVKLLPDTFGRLKFPWMTWMKKKMSSVSETCECVTGDPLWQGF